MNQFIATDKNIISARAPNIPDDDFERTFPVELCNLRYLGT